MRRSLLAIAIAALALPAGCAWDPPPYPAPVDESCLLQGPDVPATHDGVVVDSGSPPALFSTPQTAQGLYRARLVYASPTLLQVNCEGRVIPGVAQIPTGSFRDLVLEIPVGLRKADGTAVEAQDVANAWERAIQYGAGVDSVKALDSRRLLVSLERPDMRILASPDLGVFGTPSSATKEARGRLATPDARELGYRKDVRFSTRTGPVDPYDIIDRGSEATDLWIDASPAVAEYARQRGMVVAPLPYDETYVLLVPPRATRPVAARPVAGPALLDDLAMVVRDASVRPADTPPWWKYDLAGCGPLSPSPYTASDPAPLPPGAFVVYYSDPVAGDLATRLVALSAMDTTTSHSARDLVRTLPGLNGESLAARQVSWVDLGRRLERGDGFAFLVGVRNPVPDPCGVARELVRKAPWLLSDNAGMEGTMIPLVDARSFVILTSRNIAVTWDIYGTVQIFSQLPELNGL